MNLVLVCPKTWSAISSEMTGWIWLKKVGGDTLEGCQGNRAIKIRKSSNTGEGKEK